MRSPRSRRSAAVCPDSPAHSRGGDEPSRPATAPGHRAWRRRRAHMARSPRRRHRSRSPPAPPHPSSLTPPLDHRRDRIHAGSIAAEGDRVWGDGVLGSGWRVSGVGCQVRPATGRLAVWPRPPRRLVLPSTPSPTTLSPRMTGTGARNRLAPMPSAALRRQIVTGSRQESAMSFPRRLTALHRAPALPQRHPGARGADRGRHVDLADLSLQRVVGGIGLAAAG